MQIGYYRSIARERSPPRQIPSWQAFTTNIELSTVVLVLHGFELIGRHFPFCAWSEERPDRLMGACLLR
jgi:hypothetical protein